MAEHPLASRRRLEQVAAQVGTPFYLWDAAVLDARIDAIRELTAADGLQARYAMKAASTARILERMAAAGIWIDAVSGNEVLRAKRAGFAMGHEPPVVLLTTDVFRDNALAVVNEERVLPNLGSPGMLRVLHAAGWEGPIALRINPGFGHGHVQATDTGGPSSKHGLWRDDALAVAREAQRLGMPVVLLHAHVGSGPAFDELLANLNRLAGFFEELLPAFPDCVAVSLGGGLPHAYREPSAAPDLRPLGRLLHEAHARFSARAGRPIRVEIEPGRFFVAPAATLVARVTDVKQTRTNEKGVGHDFVLIDAGFTDLVRPAMYGSYHRISVVSDAPGPVGPHVVAGPLCESGDVFTRDACELVEPRELPRPTPGDFVLLHDAGAYGTAMSSNYNSLGRAPQLWWEGGTLELVVRRETLDDLLATERRTRLT